MEVAGPAPGFVWGCCGLAGGLRGSAHAHDWARRCRTEYTMPRAEHEETEARQPSEDDGTTPQRDCDVLWTSRHSHVSVTKALAATPQ